MGRVQGGVQGGVLKHPALSPGQKWQWYTINGGIEQDSKDAQYTTDGATV